MRENRLYGSEGGEAKSLPYPYQTKPRMGKPKSGLLRLALNDGMLRASRHQLAAVDLDDLADDVAAE